MNYQTIQIYNLMANEFAQVEGDFSSLHESDIKSVTPSGMRCSDFLEQLRSGHQVLLTDTPSIPLLIRDRDEWGNLYWRVNPVIESNIDLLAHRAYTARVELVNHGIGSFYSGSVNALVYTEPYIESEPVKLSLKERYDKQCRENHLNSEKVWAMLQERKAQEKAQEQQFSLGWMQVESTQSQQELWASLFTSDTTTTQKQLVKKYNAHLNEPVRQGEIVILPTVEPSSVKEKQSLSDLQEEAKAASTELAKLSDEEVATVYRHFELLDYYASNGLKYIQDNGLPSDQYAYASVGVSVVATGIESHLKHVSGIIQDINNLYVTQVAMASRTGGINYGSFIAERAALLKKLDQSFTRFSSRAVKIPAYRQVKKSLRLSTKSVIHHADEIIEKGTVPSLGKRIANISKGVASAKSIGYVGLVLGVASGVNSVYEACTVDGSGECGKTATRVIGGFLGGWGGGVAGGYITTGVTVLVLGALSITSAPVIAVATVSAVVAGGVVGGVGGGAAGKALGDVFYEYVVEPVKEIFE